jgi:hypothetical protein
MDAILPAPSVDFAALLAMPGQAKTVARGGQRQLAADMIGQGRALPKIGATGGGMASLLACRGASVKIKKR